MALGPMNAASVKIYLGKQHKTPPHCDVVYNYDGTGRAGCNSQETNTHVPIWSVGCTGELKFELHGSLKRETLGKDKNPNHQSEWMQAAIPKTGFTFLTHHLDLFNLHYDDEKPRPPNECILKKCREEMRQGNKRMRYKHSAKLKDGGFRVSVMLRCISEDCVHNVDPTTNKVILDPPTEEEQTLFDEMDAAKATKKTKADLKKWKAKHEEFVREIEHFLKREEEHQARIKL